MHDTESVLERVRNNIHKVLPIRSARVASLAVVL